MQPQFITKAAFTVVGLRIRTMPKSPDIKNVWDQFVSRMDELQNVSEPYTSYGVMASTGDALDYMAGSPVSSVSDLPAGMSAWNLSENTYAVFEASIPTLSETFDTIFGQWLPTSGYKQAEGPLLERYGENFSPENPVVDVYIPVIKKVYGNS